MWATGIRTVDLQAADSWTGNRWFEKYLNGALGARRQSFSAIAVSHEINSRCHHFLQRNWRIHRIAHDDRLRLTLGTNRLFAEIQAGRGDCQRSWGGLAIGGLRYREASKEADLYYSDPCF